MDANQMYIQNIKVEEIPWHKITTAYGRATELPAYFKTLWEMADMAAVQTALDEVTNSIEHQSTLWHSSPFAMIFLVRIFERAVSKMNNNEIADFVAEQLLIFFAVVAECFHYGHEMEHADQLPLFSDMLNEEYLWSEEYDEEEDEIRYEEEEVFPDDLFYSFYYYSYQALLSCKPMLSRFENTALEQAAQYLSDLIRIGVS